METPPVVLRRMNIACGIRIDDRQIKDAVYALEEFYDKTGESIELADALSNLCMNYIKFVDVLVMSDGTIIVAPDQHSADCIWSPIGPLRKISLEDE